MDERFPYEFVTWSHKTPLGVKVSEVFGMDSKTGKVWLELARQIFCEQGDQAYRVIEHFENGAPFIEGYPGRISITHTTHFFAVASLPKTPEVNLSEFKPRSALGIDAEPIDRQQVIKIRDRFLNDTEKDLINKEDIKSNIQAWTIKEAMYKCALTPGLDFRTNLVIKNIPPIDSNPENKNFNEFGEGEIIFPESLNMPSQKLLLYSYISYGCCISLALSPKSAKYGK